MKTKIFVCCLLALLGAGLTLSVTKIANIPVKDGGKISFCNVCVQVMGAIINDLLNIILNIGVIGTCEDLCSKLPNKYEADACDLICAYVGIEEFIRLIEYEDPDPIFFCDEAKICPTTSNGTAYTNAVSVGPTSGPASTKFLVKFNYTVTSYTSTGGPNIAVIPPDGFPLSGGELNEGQPPGTYVVGFEVDTTPSEQEPFLPGTYIVQVALCAGDCSGRHKWSGEYCNGTTHFQITRN